MLVTEVTLTCLSLRNWSIELTGDPALSSNLGFFLRGPMKFRAVILASSCRIRSASLACNWKTIYRTLLADEPFWCIIGCLCGYLWVAMHIPLLKINIPRVETCFISLAPLVVCYADNSYFWSEAGETPHLPNLGSYFSLLTNDLSHCVSLPPKHPITKM